MVSEFQSKVAGTAEAVWNKTGGKKSEIVDLGRKLEKEGPAITL